MAQQIDDPRRDFLVKALSLGLFSTTGAWFSGVYAMGDIPEKLPPGQSIYRLRGKVMVDGRPASIKTQISAGSTVATGDDSEAIFVVGKDAMILRSNSELQIGGDNSLITGMRILAGKLLTVFGERQAPLRINTLTATIGVRGTGVYVESDPEQTYLCTCYGHTEVASTENPSIKKEIMSTHHDEPLYILPGKGRNVIRPAAFINHTDVELALIEELVGRTTPFAIGNDLYEAPRKRPY